MQEKDIAVIKGLIQVMWADGELAEAEREMLGSILVNMGCSPEELQEIAGMLKEPPSVDTLLKDLPDKESRRDVIKIVYAMALADDDYADSEDAFIKKLAAKLKISPKELEELKEEMRRHLEG